MDIAIKECILAIVAIEGARAEGGGCPVFLAKNIQEQEKTSLYLARILGGVVHDLENGILIICKH
ncbi:MAG: hypothetical protein PHC92_01050 [Syntrophomonadaceae bacterium]|nr:hypothetical protein [Syntrophomonadaceae bacterium]MDD3022703.1 hypothetical protein [Syntrophomonadaceae bacterium]